MSEGRGGGEELRLSAPVEEALRLADLAAGEGARLVLEVGGERVVLPGELAGWVREALTGLALGAEVRLVRGPVDELTVEEASDVLGAPGPWYVERLVREGELPHRVVGGRVYLPATVVLEHDREMRRRREIALTEMQRDAEENDWEW